MPDPYSSFIQRIMYRYPILSFTLLLSLLLAGCAKEQSFELPTTPGTGIPLPAGDGAVFAFVAAGGSCSDAKASGIFLTGQILDEDAKVKVTVNVTRKGKWTLTSNVVNGMLVMGTGTFTQTGVQVITLQATGLPQTAGVNNILLSTGTANCSVAVTVSGSVSSTEGYYYKITVAGQTYEQAVTEDNHYEAGAGMGGVDDVTISASINYTYEYGQDPPAGTTAMSVTIGLMHNYLNASDKDFTDFFTPGNYSYVKDFYGAKGVSIDWLDPQGEQWSTQAGSADQTGSTFTIISAVDAMAFNGYYLKTKMQFKCKLYNVNTGAMKEVTNGEMVGTFGKI
ncbi:hypothetical protein [Chitinophaga sp.]|uniref:hypothetical protein n=1 Tax=Chitinophaga sp. TaxID=1869181 RepID=UPI002F95074F